MSSQVFMLTRMLFENQKYFSENKILLKQQF